MDNRIAALGPWTERAMVLGLAFGPPIYSTFYYLLYGGGDPSITTESLLELVMVELATISILAWFLRKRGWTLDRLTAAAAIGDVPVGLALGAVAYAVMFIAWALLGLIAPDLLKSSHEVTAGGAHLSFVAVALTGIVNPVFEETFVCGYVVASLGSKDRSAAAVNVSVAIRTAYHLYEGPPAIVGIIPLGLLFAWFYARTRRLLPVIVAHSLLDFVTLLTET